MVVNELINIPSQGGSGGVTSLNGESGAVVLVAGTGITITPSGNNITIASLGGNAFVTVSGTTTLAANTVYYVPTTTSAYTLNLPNPATFAAGGTTGFIWIKDSNGNANVNNITLAPFGAELIEGLAGNRLLQTAWGGWKLASDSVNWFYI